jgi:GAF domain-containing protein
MQRGSGSGQPVKGQCRSRPKARKAPTAHVTGDRPPKQITRSKRERDEALEQLAATSEILRVIRTSPTDVQPVFETIVRSAVSLCGSVFANVFRFDGELLHWVTSHNVDPSIVDLLKTKFPMRPDRSQVVGRVLLTKSVIRLEDALTDPDYDQRFPGRRLLGVPMLREGDPVGVIVIGWAEAGPVTKAQEQLLKTFADQAAIAIENTRLLSELRESLQQQTATADVLKVISRSAFDLRTVLQALVESAARFCSADKANVIRERNGAFYSAESCGFSQELVDYLKDVPIEAERGTASGRALLEGRVIHIADVKSDPEYTLVEGQRLGDYRTILSVPMLRESVPIGVLNLLRSEIRPFTDKQIELVTTFADQAAIAIENVRLLGELNREREALARQHQADARYISWLRQLAGFLRHEVRQPVAQINSSVELIHLTSHDDQLRPYIASASQGVRHVWNLIERASRATDAEAFVRQGQAQPIDLPPLLRELIGSYQQTHSGIDFRLQPPDKEPLYVSADPTLLKEAVSNLLANAASFADEESIIQVVLERDGVHAVIKVRNKGPIIQYDTEMLFGPFASTRSGPSSEHQGLGLYLVRLVAEHHGGKAIISNLDDGSGVEASIFLPL